jgi:hypothetical protein
MRPKQRETSGSNDLLRARLEQIINMKHELVVLAGKIERLCSTARSRPLQRQGRFGHPDQRLERSTERDRFYRRSRNKSKPRFISAKQRLFHKDGRTIDQAAQMSEIRS